MARRQPIPMFLVTDLRSDMIYVLEPSRRGSRMPARRRELDVRIPYAKVPLYIRRAAREALL